jgi:hypothetical protein
MTVMVGLDNAQTAELRAALAGGTLERSVVDFLTRAVLPQSPGWQLHTKAACAIIGVCATTLRRLKKIVATLPGIRRVFFRSLRGQVYEGLLVGDYVEGAGYPVVSWVDDDGVVHEGFPPKTVDLVATVTDSVTAPAGHRGGAAPEQPQKKPREQKGWRRFEDQAREVVAKTPARSVRGVAMIIRWAVEDEGHDTADIVARLVRLGDGIGVTKAALINDLSPANAPEAQPASAEDEPAREPNLRRSCEVAVALRPAVTARPELAPGAAILEALAQYRRVTATAMDADRWLQQVRGDIGDFTAAEGFAAVDRVHAAGRPLTAEWIARGVRAGR